MFLPLLVSMDWLVLWCARTQYALAFHLPYLLLEELRLPYGLLCLTAVWATENVRVSYQYGLLEKMVDIVKY